MNLALYCARMTGYSGVELYTLDLAVALARAGHGVTVVADGFGDHLLRPLVDAEVACRPPGSEDPRVDFCITPKDGPMQMARATGARVVQVIHSEHRGDVPEAHPSLCGVVMIRDSQRMLLNAAPWVSGLPRAVIRNPVDGERVRASVCHELARVPRWNGVLVSEFDDFKARLAAEYQRKVGGEVLLVGPWRSREAIPYGCTLTDATLAVGQFYDAAATACSYRLSRTLVEAALCGVPVWVRGGLEPRRDTCDDPPDDWNFLRSSEIDVSAFNPAFVAAAWVDFLGAIK